MGSKVGESRFSSLILSAICRQFAQSIVHTFFEGEEVKNRLISAEQFE